MNSKNSFENKTTIFKGQNNNQIGEVSGGVGINNGTVIHFNTTTTATTTENVSNSSTIAKFKYYVKEYGITFYDLAKYLRIKTYSNDPNIHQNEVLAHLEDYDEDVELAVIYTFLYKLEMVYLDLVKEGIEEHINEHKIRIEFGLYIPINYSANLEDDDEDEEYKKYLTYYNRINENFITYLIAFTHTYRIDLDIETICFMIDAELPVFMEYVQKIIDTKDEKQRWKKYIEFCESFSEHMRPFL